MRSLLESFRGNVGGSITFVKLEYVPEVCIKCWEVSKRPMNAQLPPNIEIYRKLGIPPSNYSYTLGCDIRPGNEVGVQN